MRLWLVACSLAAFRLPNELDVDYFGFRNQTMKVSIITIGLWIFYFSASSASPSPQHGSDPCYCQFPNSRICQRNRKQNGCSGSGGFATTESAFTSSGKFAYNSRFI